MEPTEIEQQYVLETYSKISEDFSRTRYKPWPSVQRFMDNIPTLAILADIGCGNCKNLRLRPINSIGIDIVHEFVEMGSKLGLDTRLGSILDIPLETNSVDFCMSIAVLHHLSTEEHRIKGINELIRITKPGGKIHFQVWSYEQPEKSKRKFLKGDNYVDWKNVEGELVGKRYYYIYNKEMLEETLSKLDGIKIEEFYNECGNWIVTIEKL
jgi:SAM-dependent methyltransferase